MVDRALGVVLCKSLFLNDLCIGHVGQLSDRCRGLSDRERVGA